MELAILDEKTVRAAIKRARIDGFLGERRSASIWGTTERWIIIEGFRRYEEELVAIKAEYKRRHQAGPPTEEEIEAWDAIGRDLCWYGEHRGVFTQEQVKRMRTFLFTHLGMSLRFDPRAPGEWTIVRRNAPVMEHDPRWHKNIAEFVRDAFTEGRKRLVVGDVKPSNLEAVKALFSWHWPSTDLNFRTKPNREHIKLTIDIPATPPRVREGLILDEYEPPAPAPEPVPSPAPPPPTPALKLPAEDDPSQDIPF
jgi:hypothetical protein